MREAILFAMLFVIFALLIIRARPLGVGRAIVSFVVALIITAIFARSWVEVPPGMVGTVYDPFAGGIQRMDLGGGWRLIKPWSDMRLWSVRTQEYTMSGRRDEGAIVGDDSMVCQTKE